MALATILLSLVSVAWNSMLTSLQRKSIPFRAFAITPNNMDWLPWRTPSLFHRNGNRTKYLHIQSGWTGPYQSRTDQCLMALMGVGWGQCSRPSAVGYQAIPSHDSNSVDESPDWMYFVGCCAPLIQWFLYCMKEDGTVEMRRFQTTVVRSISGRTFIFTL